MKKIMLCLAGLIISTLAFSQSILTASSFFQSISEYYSTITDYEATLDITAGKTDMSGKVSFKRPEMLRIDFTNPQDQVILFNGDDLTIYLPGYSAVLQQTANSSGAGAASLATPQGLNLMSRYYTIAYETGQDAVPLEEGSDENVVNLILNRRSSAEAFRQIKLSINPQTKLIRRVVATTPQSENFTFNFYDYNLNSGITDQRFIYDPPSSANNYNNFLFSE